MNFNDHCIFFSVLETPNANMILTNNSTVMKVLNITKGTQKRGHPKK